MNAYLLRYRTLIVILASLAVFSLGMTNLPTQKLDTQQKDIARTIMDMDNFRTLEKTLKHTRLLNTFKEEGPFTLFAPTDEAFARLPDELLANLMGPHENEKKLASILTYHTLPKKIMAREVIERPNAKTINGQFLTIRKKGNAIFVNSSKIIMKDILCSNGVIHVIDTVLIPKQTQPL